MDWISQRADKTRDRPMNRVASGVRVNSFPGNEM